MQKLMSKEQIREFIKEKGLVTADDAIKALKDLLKDTIEEMAEAELETELVISSEHLYDTKGALDKALIS